ncbi:HypC/HybG/HupF family hydrogenase formation chaperone [Pontibacter sp. JAM-7]|uniref:HypC/HybG/HupF family hydrogenase formation chaperone n=1 Tax=Pontibacter sp. JAM-7 TaxID=3366581 RepID=UPI003AF49A9B
MCLGVPGQIVAISDPESAAAIINVSGVKREVNLSCVIPECGDLTQLIGRWALVHVGFAMSLIDEDEAQKTLQVLAELGELQEELDAIQNSLTQRDSDV